MRGLVTRDIEDVFSKLYGLPCWGVHWDGQVGLRMHFGCPRLETREPVASQPRPGKQDVMRIYRWVRVEGEWELWVGPAFWKLYGFRDDLPVVRGSSSYRRIQMGLARLDGQKLVRAVIDPRSALTRFEFDLGVVLEVWSLGSDVEYATWSLCTPEHQVLKVRGDGYYALGPSDSSDHAWQPLRRA